MVLQRGRTYDEIANLLSIDRSAVRQRALDACDALTPDGIAPGPEQALVTDYLLSQLPEQVAEQVYIYLEAADGDREWAGTIADRLEPLASKPLPEVPVAAPLGSDEAALGDQPYMDPKPLAPAAAPGPQPASPARIGPDAPPAPGAQPARARPREPRRISGIVVAGLSALTAIIAAVVIVLIANSGSSSPKPKRVYTYTHPGGRTATQTKTTVSTTTTAGSGLQILAAMNLTSPVGATKTIGVAQVVRDNGVLGIVIVAQDVPANSAQNAYGVWLYNSATSYKFLGFDPNLVGKNEKLEIAPSPLPADASDFKRLLITVETQQKPKTPGEVVLSAPFHES